MNKDEIAYQRIKRDIISRRFESSVPISESLLVDNLQMSRTPIRSALQRLQAEGFVKIIPNQGAIIYDISLEEAAEIYELRNLVETFMIRNSYPLLRIEDIEEMRAILNQELTAVSQNDFLSYLLYDIDFHLKGYSRYHNSKMLVIISNYKERVIRSRIKTIRQNDLLRNSLEEHDLIVTNLEQGNISKAIDCAISHISKGVHRAFLM